MKTLQTIIFLILGILAQAQTTEQLLEKAFKKKSKRTLELFFSNWQQEIKPISDIELFNLNDTIKQAYSVFTEFYMPKYINSLDSSEWGTNIYETVDFLIIQNSINIYFTDKILYLEKDIDKYVVEQINRRYSEDSTRQNILKRTNGKLSESVLEYYQQNIKFTFFDSIINFRPQINCNETLWLYLTPKYQDVLDSFLGKSNNPRSTISIFSPREFNKRKLLLENHIKLTPGPWGLSWQYYSYPRVYSITFDPQMQYARVDFRMRYDGGEAILKNENGRWKLICVKRLWIE